MSITPQQKIQLMRQYDMNPSSAILTVADMLRKEMEEILAKEVEKINQKEKELTNIIKELSSQPKLPPEIVAKIRAVKGDKGDKGETGDTYVLTPENIQSIMKIITPLKGRDYFDGEIGTNGKDGLSIVGPQGPKGDKPIAGIDYQIPQNGKDGLPGKNGSPDTPIEIATKLNTTTESVEFSVIKGLRKFMTDLKLSVRNGGEKSVKQSGGGMGNVQHENKSVSSASTTVTTNYKIAGNGYALWAYYQGQLIARGTHYTVGANRKTLTLLFTPQDSTNIDIIYIRS